MSHQKKAQPSQSHGQPPGHPRTQEPRLRPQALLLPIGRELLLRRAAKQEALEPRRAQLVDRWLLKTGMKGLLAHLAPLAALLIDPALHTGVVGPLQRGQGGGG